MNRRARERVQERSPHAKADVASRETAAGEAASLERAVLWSAAAFVAVGVVGFLVVPGLRFLWIVFLIFGIAAVPAALRRDS